MSGITERNHRRHKARERSRPGHLGPDFRPSEFLLSPNHRRMINNVGQSSLLLSILISVFVVCRRPAFVRRSTFDASVRPYGETLRFRLANPATRLSHGYTRSQSDRVGYTSRRDLTYNKYRKLQTRSRIVTRFPLLS